LRLVPAKISFYSGSRADETPRAFMCEGVTREVKRLLGERLIKGLHGVTEREYLVQVEGEGHFRLLYRDGEGYVILEED